jgi:hypothetical protein
MAPERSQVSAQMPSSLSHGLVPPEERWLLWEMEGPREVEEGRGLRASWSLWPGHCEADPGVLMLRPAGGKGLFLGT